MRLEDRHLSHKQGGQGDRLQGLAEHIVLDSVYRWAG